MVKLYGTELPGEGSRGDAENSRLEGRGDIFGSGLLQQFLGRRDFLGCITAHIHQDAAVFGAPFVAFGLILRNSHPDQGTRCYADIEGLPPKAMALPIGRCFRPVNAPTQIGMFHGELC